MPSPHNPSQRSGKDFSTGRSTQSTAPPAHRTSRTGARPTTPTDGRYHHIAAIPDAGSGPSQARSPGGCDDPTWPVVELLERAAIDDHPFDIGVIKVHSADPAGAAKFAQVLRHWGYRARVVPASPDLGHLDGRARTA